MDAAGGHSCRHLVTLVSCAPLVVTLGVACAGESTPVKADCIKPSRNPANAPMTAYRAGW
jgi:hypothetical protein